MKHKIIIAACMATLFALFSCKKEEPAAPGTNEILLQIGDYPSFSESKVIGTPDAGKTEWKNADVLYLVLQTSADQLAARYRITRSSDKWGTYEKYEGGNYTSVTQITIPGTCRAVVYYAPSYEFAQSVDLQLKKDCVAGLDEFLKWKSGDEYNITESGTTLSVKFVKDYSRIRVSSEAGYSVSMEASSFIPVGYNTAALGTKTLSSVADANANSFFYGTWPDNSTFQFKSYDKSGAYVTSETISNKSKSENGISYAVSCNDEDFTTIAELAAKATSTTASNFSVTIKNVVVSYAIGQYAHIEDASGALMIYYSSHGLSAGQRINGTISGKIKLYNNIPQITSIDFSKATITSDGIIPETVMTIADLQKDFKANLSRRILIKGVTVDTGISSGTTAKRSGQISQNGSSIAIYGVYTASPAVIETGLKGDLIAFPAYYNSVSRLSVYESSHFTESGTGEDTAFTRLTVMGCYSATDTENPVAVMTYNEGQDQYSSSKSSSALGWNLFNLENGTYAIIGINATSLTAGSDVTAKVVINGGSQETHTVKVAKKSGTNAWLEDKTNHVGYVISLQ